MRRLSRTPTSAFPIRRCAASFSIWMYQCNASTGASALSDRS
jgi:hypothetical protein